MDHATENRLASLDGLSGYKVAEGDPDVRGWDVIGRDGRRIGEVDDLLVDTAALKVRYLEVRLDRRLVVGEEEGTGSLGAPEDARPTGATTLRGSAIPELDSMRDSPDDGVIGHVAAPEVAGGERNVPTASIAESLIRGTLSDVENRMTADHHLGEQPYAGERHILVPIGRARLDTDEDRVVVETLTAERAAELPPYEHGALEQGYEERIRYAFGATNPAAQASDPYDDSELYDERIFFSSRRPAGSTRSEEL